MISVCEQSLLNYLYLIPSTSDSNKNNYKNKTKSTVEEKILSYSDSYNHLYKNVLQFITLNKSDYLYLNLEHPYEYFKYIKIIEILNLLKLGKISIAINFLKLFIEDCSSSINSETVEILINLLYEVMEFDIEFSLVNIYRLYKRFSDLNAFDYIINLIKYKLEYFKGNVNNNNSHHSNFEIYNLNQNKTIKNIEYYRISVEFYKLLCKINDNINCLSNEAEILKLKETCLNFKFNRFIYLLEIELATVYIKQGRQIEASTILNNIISSDYNSYVSFKAELTMCKFYAKTNNIIELKNNLQKLYGHVFKYGSIIDKIDYFSLKCQINVLDGDSYQFNLNISQFLKHSMLAGNTSQVNNAFILINHYLQSNINLKNIKSILDNFININNKFNKLTENHVLDVIQELELYNIKLLKNKNLQREIEKLINIK